MPELSNCLGILEVESPGNVAVSLYVGAQISCNEAGSA